MDRKGKRALVSDQPARQKKRRFAAVTLAEENPPASTSATSDTSVDVFQGTLPQSTSSELGRLSSPGHADIFSTLKASLSKIMRERRRLYLMFKRKPHLRMFLMFRYQHTLTQLATKSNRLHRRIKLLKTRRKRLGCRTIQPFTLGTPDCVCQFCGAIMWRQESTSASRNRKNPKFSLCCMEGKVKLPPIKEPPPFLKWLLESDHSLAKHFREFIRAYNAVFSFTSMGGKVDHSVNRGRGPYVFCIGGQIYHHIGSLLPPPHSAPKFAQLYIHQTSEEISNRQRAYNVPQRSNPLQEDLIQQLKEMLDEHNQLVQVFRYARDTLQTQEVHEMELRLLSARRRDGREYDLPASRNELAALVVNDTGIETYDQDIIVQLQSTQLTRINMRHPSLMALQYPLLFPYGEDGWRPDITIPGGFLTQRQFYAYRLQTRLQEAPTLLLSGKLFQQYVVNAYTLIEAERLDWIRQNQRKLRYNILSGILDSFLSGDADVNLTGKHVILSSSHTGSPRYMFENFQDAMAICRWFGYPDLFLTFTCNAGWPEIQYFVDLIKVAGWKDPNRADIIARIFRLKLNELLHEIKTKHIFGRTCAEIYTIEFQKRGLPHAHLLIFLVPEDKFIGPDRIDSIISAEIPDKNEDPDCFRAVEKFMIHGPCGVLQPSATCTSQGKCQRHFPKKFHAETSIDEDGFPIYRRRQDGRTIVKNGIPLDNRFVVPYNRYLLLRFGAHINVEWCNKSRSIKYLFKYITKSPDRTLATLVQAEGVSHAESTTAPTTNHVVDEIKSYMDCRYISAPEASWRIFKFDIHHHRPSVLRMSYHLPGETPVVYEENQPMEKVKEQAEKDTMLIAWMKTNIADPDARDHTFVDFPVHYVWDVDTREWRKRKSKLSIGRLYSAQPSAEERFYLRMLLHVVKGCQSFEDIRTFNGIIYESFQKACYARGFLENDNEWNDCLQEASSWATGVQLRKLFVTLLTCCQVSDPQKMWEKNSEILCDGILYKRRQELQLPNLELTTTQLHQCALNEIEKMLRQVGKTLSDFPGLPSQQVDSLCSSINRLIGEELCYNTGDLAEEVKHNLPLLNAEQRSAYEEIIASIDGDLGKTFFIDGYGGTGKTLLWQVIISQLRANGKIVLPVASSGIAALLLYGARTAHSRFHIPLSPSSTATCNIAQGDELAELIQQAAVIIWDEAPLAHKHCMEALDKTLRDILRQRYPDSKDKPFGGLTVVFGGDFRQVLPVIPKGTRTETVSASLKKSYLWDSITVIKLTQNMRLHQPNCSVQEATDISEFSSWVLSIGNGLNCSIMGEAEIPIPEDIIAQRHGSVVEDIVSSTYPDLKQHYNEVEYLQGRAILAPHHEMVGQINTYMLGQIPGEVSTYYSSDSIANADGTGSISNPEYPIEFLNTLQPGGLPNYELKLSVGVPVLLLRNIDQTSGLCNGTRLIIRRLGQWSIEAEILTGTHIGDHIFLPRIVLTAEVPHLNITLRRRQYPISLCFAMTINKSQGQSLRQVGLCLQHQVFCHGQLYVAVSRVTTRKGLKILSCDEEGHQLKTMKNIVFKEVLNEGE